MLTKYQIVGAQGVTHLHYDGTDYPLDANQLTDAQAQFLADKTTYLVKLPEPVQLLPAPGPVAELPAAGATSTPARRRSSSGSPATGKNPGDVAG